MSQFGLRGDEFDDGTLLFSSGILDSFDLLAIISLIEREEGIRVQPSDVSLDNFDSVTRLREYVARRSGL